MDKTLFGFLDLCFGFVSDFVIRISDLGNASLWNNGDASLVRFAPDITTRFDCPRKPHENP
jgi:hypothetical protein